MPLKETVLRVRKRSALMLAQPASVQELASLLQPQRGPAPPRVLQPGFLLQAFSPEEEAGQHSRGQAL